jgi:hypothetical protein
MALIAGNAGQSAKCMSLAFVLRRGNCARANLKVRSSVVAFIYFHQVASSTASFIDSYTPVWALCAHTAFDLFGFVF